MPWRQRLLDYLRTRLPSAGDLSIARISGMPAGASNETIAIDLAVACDGYDFVLPLVLRPERADGILAPYDVSRQFHVMRALAATDVPVPAVLWLEQDRSVLGAPFYFMERVRGETLPLFWYGSASPRLPAVAATLARIHAVDWRSAGLAFLLPGEAARAPLPSPLECDLAAWRQRAGRAALHEHPVLRALDSFLAKNEPADARHALLHGDPNPGNYLVGTSDVVAVVDWEVAAIGDPRSDLGFYAALLSMFGGMPGEGGRTVLSQAYESVSGRPLANLGYYEGVGLYKMAVVLAGWSDRAGAGYAMEAIARRLSVLFGPSWAA
jgi:aminoglycoside phosphotransferase (APT) family kinase protein